jgi:hypothetical protein
MAGRILSAMSKWAGQTTDSQVSMRRTMMRRTTVRQTSMRRTIKRVTGLLACATACALATTASAQTRPNVVLSQTTVLAGYPAGGAFGSGTAAGTTFGVNSKGLIIAGTAYGNTIVQVNGTTGAVTTLGAYSNPGPVAVDGADNFYIGDLYDATIVKVPNGAYATVHAATSSTPVCKGSDTVECTLPSLVSGPYGYAAMVFDAAGDFFFTSTNGGSAGNAIFECSAACLKSATPAATMLFQEPTSAAAQLIVGGVAADAFGDLFFTDSVVDSNEKSSVSNVKELLKSGSGFSSTATVLYTLTIAAPGNYDNQITGVAVDASGTVYFADEFDGVYAFPNANGAITASKLYTVSNTGAKILGTDKNGNFYIAAYANSTGGDAFQRVSVGLITAPATAAPSTSTAANVITILNDQTGCGPAVVTYTAQEKGVATTEFTGAQTGACAVNNLTSANTYATTVNFTPTNPSGTRSGVLTAMEGNGNSGTANVTGVATGGADVVLTQTTVLGGYPNGGAFGSGTAAGTTFGVNSLGNLIASTSYGGSIVQVNGMTGVVTTLGAYNNPGPVGVDPANNFYVADLYDTTIVKVPYGAYATVAAPTASTPACTGSDTAECTLPTVASGPYGWSGIAFDAAGDLFISSTNGGGSGNSIYECTAACLKSGTPAARLIFQEPVSATAQLIIGGLATDTYGDVFFTDSVVDSNEKSSVSHVDELKAATGGTGFSSTPTVLYTLTIAAPSNYDNQITSVAVGPNGTVYFADEFDGIFGFPSNAGAVTTSTLYTYSTTGAKIMTTDEKGNFYIAAYSGATGGDAFQRVGIGQLVTPSGAVGSPVTATNVTTILNDVQSCTPAPTVTFTASENGSSTTEFSAATSGSCATANLGNASTFPTTVTFKAAALGTRMALLTGTETNGNSGSAVVTGISTGPATATPTFAPAAGTYTSIQSVTIADTSAGAVIYYTTDGSTPTTGSTQYTGAITVASSETIEAIALAPGDGLSNVATAAYTINLPAAATPTFSPAGGTYMSIQSVAISDTTAGSTIYYTTDGSTPTTGSTKYTGQFAVSQTETVNAIAVAYGYSTSAVATANYTINLPAATPTFNPPPTTYNAVQNVTISDATPGATIYYTTNGSTPTTASTVYTKPIVVGVSETLQAIAVAAGYSTSAVGSAAYVISLPTFGLTINPGSLTIATNGGQGTANVVVTPANTFAAAVTFACSGLPAGATCSFAPATVTPFGSYTVTSVLTISSTVTTKTSELERKGAPWQQGPAAPIAAMVFGLGLLGLRRKRGMRLLMVVLLSCGTLGLIAGCSSSTSTAHTPVTSMVTVTATSGTIVKTATVSLTTD